MAPSYLALILILGVGPRTQTQPPQQPADAATVQVPERPGLPPAQASAAELIDTADRLREQKAYLDSLDYYRLALKKGGQSADLHNKMGIAYLQLSKHDNAKKEFERATRLDQNLPEPWNNLGVVHYIRKSYKRAIKYYMQALELRSESASFHSNLGTAYFARKEYDQAAREYLRALELDPDIFERRTSAGVQAHLASPEDRAYYDYMLARMFARQGNLDRCLQYLRKAMEEGYAKIDAVYKDEEFANVRKDPRFAKLMAQRPQPIPD